MLYSKAQRPNFLFEDKTGGFYIPGLIHGHILFFSFIAVITKMYDPMKQQAWHIHCERTKHYSA